MACSKELRIPKPWLKYHDEIAKEPVDPKLFSLDKLCAWLKDLDLCHSKSDVAKYVLHTKPYHLVRHQVVLLPNNVLCRELFTLWANTALALFISDDVLELSSDVDMRQICDAFQLLDDHISKKFPQFPTIGEIKQFLLLQKLDEKFIPHVIYFQDFSNNVAKAIMEHGSFSEEQVKYFWRRLVVMIALYYEGVGDEVKHTVGLYSMNVWTRLLAAGAMIWVFSLEIMSGVLGKTTKHLPLLNELYFNATFFAMVVNDIYSYKREMSLDASICNLVQTIIVGKEASGQDEAVQKCVEILNAVVKVSYQKIEKAKRENPGDQDLWKLLDNIGMATAGWYFLQHFSPRYDDSPWRLSVAAVESAELQEWRQCTDEDPPNEVKPLLINHNAIAKRISDAIISGRVNMHGNL
jgi:hypothetical protein